ncbi:helix-turn-helix domain-containing protein [Candidatus Palauibacter sp.]|uniref:helix-turn-helix domain-containing protein n=1 Tax=Candidatus Palauibacter sp. TaxID=3101350 RepID=UPI003CC58F87
MSAVADSMDPGEFRARRAELRLSVRELARVLGVTPRTIYRWQSGKQRVPGPAAAAIRSLIASGGDILSG